MKKKLFLLFSLGLLFSTGMWANVEFNPEWKEYQKKFYKEQIINTRAKFENSTSDKEKEILGKELANLQKSKYEIKQILLKGSTKWSDGENGVKVDRCMTCHLGINKEDSISEEQPFSSHPRSDVYLQNHPPEEFGCVMCHEGQTRAMTSPEIAHGEIEHCSTPMNRGKLAQSSCIVCHGNKTELVGGEEVWKGIKLFQELGCYGCHATEGFGEDENRMVAPDLSQIGSKVDVGWLIDWLLGPKKFRPSTRMPDFSFTEDDALSIAAYLWQNSKGHFPDLPRDVNEDMIDEGAFIFESVGCFACHSDLEEDGKIHGPNLARIGEQMEYEYMVSWLLDPSKLSPKTTMPNLRLDDESAGLLAEYLMTLKSEGYEEKSVDQELLEDPEMAKQGEKLIQDYGCSGCHIIKGMEGLDKIGVELSEIGSKGIHFFDFGSLEHEILGSVGLEHAAKNVGKARYAWIGAKLSDPRQFDPETLKMPNFNLSKEETESLSVLLLGLKENKLDESYIRKTSLRDKHIIEGNRVVEKFNCKGCHQFTIDTLYLNDGNKFEGMVKLEEEDSLYFQLWMDTEELKKKAGDTVQIPKDQIKSIERAEGGEDMASLIIDYHVDVDGMMPEEARVFTPPVLYGEGNKVQCSWLFGFLEEPVALRPWLDIRMPTFNITENEATAVSRYFAVVDDEEFPFEDISEKRDAYIKLKEEEFPGYLSRAKDLFMSKDIKCASCHVRGDLKPEGNPADWAPDLMLARERLKPEWIKNWLLDPQLIQPGTKMPKFFREGAFQDIFPGTPEEQTEAIKDLLMNLSEDMFLEE